MKNIIMLTISGLALTIMTSCASLTAKPYPKDTCIVTDNELGSMGDYVSMVYKGQEIKFCCKPCIKKFNKDPEKYMKTLQE